MAGTRKRTEKPARNLSMPRAKVSGLPAEHYFVSKETYEYFAEHKKKLLADYDRWEETWQAWRKKNPEQAQQLDDAIDKKVPSNLLEEDPAIPD